MRWQCSSLQSVYASSCKCWSPLSYLKLFITCLERAKSLDKEREIQLQRSLEKDERLMVFACFLFLFVCFCLITFATVVRMEKKTGEHYCTEIWKWILLLQRAMLRVQKGKALYPSHRPSSFSYAVIHENRLKGPPCHGLVRYRGLRVPWTK